MIDAMENAHTYPTPEQLAALKTHHAQRLLDMAEALLQSFEDMPLPKDAAGMDRAGKALLTLHKVMDTLHGHASAIAYKASVDDARPDAPEPQKAVQALKVYQMAQDIRLQTLALKRGPKPDEQATNAPRNHSP
jgi:hypothetical protein